MPSVKFSALALALTLGTPSFAQQTDPPLSVLSGEWTGDDLPDAMILRRSTSVENRADLIVYHGDYEHGLVETQRIPAAIGIDPMTGQLPRLVVTDEQGIGLQLEQTGHGRWPWMMTVQLAYLAPAGGDERRYVITGADFQTYDRLAVGRYTSCFVDYIAGRITVERGDEGADTPVQNTTHLDQAPPPLSELPNWGPPSLCFMG